MTTGAVEVAIRELEILNTCPTLPFMVDGEDEANENLRLKHRYLDLRTDGMQQRIKMRHDATWAVEKLSCGERILGGGDPHVDKIHSRGCPGLSGSLSGESRSILCPAPVSPALQQILMAGGTDRYYQIARCYRDEDARGTGQPEFTQIDLEMSFASRDDVLELVEGMMVRTFKDVLDFDVPAPFPRITWHDALDTYGPINPICASPWSSGISAHLFPGSDFGVFKSVLESGGAVKAMVVEGAAESYSRKKISELEETAKSRGAKGLAWMKVTSEGLDGGVSKFYADQAEAIRKSLEASDGDLILLMGADWKTAVESLGAVRSRLGKDLGLAKPGISNSGW
jgi:aspartyl-tRNA synthetase